MQQRPFISISKTVFALVLILSFSASSFAQFGADAMEGMADDDLLIDGDIFTDFNEDLESAQILETERFYRYGRFFDIRIGLGLTSFDGTRGSAYEDQHPSYNLAVSYFSSFQTAFTLGVAYSKHYMVINQQTQKFEEAKLGLVETNYVRMFFGFRYYLDTSDLGTAITYSNPYGIVRMEYWYQTNKYVDHPDQGKDSGGGFGTAIGGGLEFPVEIKESYINLEVLYHFVNFFDRYTTDYSPAYNNMVGNVYTVFLNYVITW